LNPLVGGYGGLDGNLKRRPGSPPDKQL